MICAARSRVTTSTAGTDNTTWWPTISRRFAAARLTPIFASSVRASSSSSSSSIRPADGLKRPRSTAVRPRSRKSARDASVSGLGRKAAPICVRPRDDLVLAVRRDQRQRHLGLQVVEFGRQSETVPAGHVEVQQGDIGAWSLNARQLHRRSSPRPGPNPAAGALRLGDRHPRQLAVVDDQNLVDHNHLSVVRCSGAVRAGLIATTTRGTRAKA